MKAKKYILFFSGWALNGLVTFVDHLVFWVARA